MFKEALKLNPTSAIAMVEYANGLVMLEGDKRMKEAEKLYAEAAACDADRRDGAARRGDGQGRTGGLSAGRAIMWMAFVLTSLVLAVTPGPGVLYIVTRTLAQGRAAGLASVAGVALGNLGNALAASLGLAALFALSSLAFAVVKWAGAAYLVWLGVRALRQAPAAAGVAAPAFAPPRLVRIARDGFVVALLNPKTALFFAAFLPQFLPDASAASVARTAMLGTLFVAVAAVTDSGYVLLAGAAARALAGRVARRTEALGRYAAAATYIGLGLYTATTTSAPAQTR